MKEYRDYYFLKAKQENYPARSVYKLQEMDKENIFFIPVYTLNYMAYTNVGLTIPEDCLGNTWYYFDYQFEDWDIAG